MGSRVKHRRQCKQWLIVQCGMHDTRTTGLHAIDFKVKRLHARIAVNYVREWAEHDSTVDAA